ncbi:MAG: adenylate cyclase [Phenylobacterium sp.]|jgi:adenylate cyclase
MKLYFPFRYKLTAVFALIIVALLFAIFNMVQKDIETQFRVLIEEQLIQAKGYVSQRMDDRYELLYNDATAIVDDKLIRDIINDQTLSTLTRNDIVTAEVLPKFTNLDVLAVTDVEGQPLAQQPSQEAITDALISSEWYEFALDGEPVAGYIFHDGVFYQGIAMPAFLGEEMIGIVVAGRVLSQQDISQIKQISHIDISVLDDDQRVITTKLSGLSESEVLLPAFDQWLNGLDTVEVDKTMQVSLGDERFLLRYTVDDTLFVPPYVIARSLDESVGFVTRIRVNMQALGSAGLLIAILISFGFAVGVSTPIKRLAMATTQVAKENFAHRVNITSSDEFSELGQSFNQMITDLGEKQKIRSALDKSVSPEVADHMLAQGVELGGTKQHATILFADIRGFTSLSESLDEKSLINLLNEYFTAVNSCIIEQQGVIDKFIGDAVMALFGTPIANEHSAYCGLLAARNMLDTVELFNHQASQRYGCELHIGIGLNSGDVVAGMVGSADRLNYTVLGDEVNVASRIEGLCKQYGVALMLSESTVNDIRQCEQQWTVPVHFRLLDCVQVKGSSRGLKVYQPFFNADEQLIKHCEHYELALGQLMNAQLALAHELLITLAKLWPEDVPTVNLLKDCIGYIQDSAGFDEAYCDGVRILTVK